MNEIGNENEKLETQQSLQPEQPVNQMVDQYDDLKTSSFYNESYKKPGKGRLKSLIIPLIIVSLLSSLMTGGIVASYFMLSGNQSGNKINNNVPSLNTPVVQENAGIRQVEIVNDVASPVVAIAAKVGPSVVGVEVKYVYEDMFFGQQTGGGSGSGIIYRSDGYIITNNHVVEQALEKGSNQILKGSTIEVILPDQEEKPYMATVIGRDSRTDIAVLKIEASNLPAVEFADSDKIEVGELAVAIGNPAGLEFMGSVTGGYISGVNRKLQFDDGKTMKLIQTDAAINPGNSGGALVNSKGQVIGINSSKIAVTGYEGLGFAIPSNVAKETTESLINNGYVKGRPQLGIAVDTSFNNDIADENGVPHGVLVSGVTPLSGAFRAGIKPGDILTKLNKVAISSFDELEEQKNKFKSGDTIEIELYRMPEKGDPKDGVYKTVNVTLGEDKGK